MFFTFRFSRLITHYVHSYGYMIDNIILLLTGTLHEREMSELLSHCHPLGTFKAMETLGTCHNMSELYHTVLIDTPLGPYIAGNLSEEDFDSDANNIEVVRNTLYKAYLKDFYQFCCTVGDDTALTMKDILEFEADRRAITITLNSFDTSLTKDDRAKLYPDFGKLAPGIRGVSGGAQTHKRNRMNTNTST